MTEQRVRYGWQSDFPEFHATAPGHIRERLQAFVRDASPEQLRAWADAIPPLQHEIGEVLLRDQFAGTYSAILEYELPLEARRPDVVLLVGNGAGTGRWSRYSYLLAQEGMCGRSATCTLQDPTPSTPWWTNYRHGQRQRRSSAETIPRRIGVLPTADADPGGS